MAMAEKGRWGGLAVMGLWLAWAAVPTFAWAEAEAQGKDLCLLKGENCPDKKETITEIIERLKREIARGEKVYTREELARLQRKLDDYEYLLYILLYSPSRP